MLIDYGDDPSRPPALAEAQPVNYSYWEDTKANYNTSTVTTATTYPSPYATTPTNAVVPYAFNDYNSSYNSTDSVSAVENEAKALKTRRRRRRRARMAAAGVSGAIVGGIALGPLGAAAGGVAAAAATRAVSKLGERRKDGRVEREKVTYESVAGSAPILNAVSC